MKWYCDRTQQIHSAQPILAVCGDDCAACPRYLAQTEEELSEVAEFWYRVGWRDCVVPPEAMRCNGCGTRAECSYGVLLCIRGKQLQKCNACDQFPCATVQTMLAASQAKEQNCREACSYAETFTLLKRAFYQKEQNL